MKVWSEKKRLRDGGHEKCLPSRTVEQYSVPLSWADIDQRGPPSSDAFSQGDWESVPSQPLWATKDDGRLAKAGRRFDYAPDEPVGAK
jgi:hypothetical protein